ncbi:MAG: ABC transporter substrate-binding protein [Alphaproteobacteria bacterium]|nr:ABC transporter substrate-binding protein [Alphaproteobacteria bacterium]
MKKFLLSLCMLLALAACKDENKTTEQVSAKPVIKIGVIDALSGKYAENGQNVQQVIEFARQNFENSGIDFKFIFEDYGYETKRAAIVTNKLINADKVDALISWSSMAGNVVSPIADKAKLIHFAICNDDNVAKGKYNFTHFTPSQPLAEKLVKQIEDKQGKKVALFAVYQPALQKHTDAVEKLLQAKGIETERFNFNMDNLDFDLMLEKAKQHNFDAWFLCALPPSLDIFLKTYFQKNIDIPLFAIDSLLFAQDKDLVEGMSFVTTPDGNKELLEKLTATNGSTNYFSVGYAYDVANLLMKAYTDLYKTTKRIPSSDEVADYLLQLKGYKGAVGELIMDENGVIMSPAVVKQMKNGKPITVEE